MGEQLLKCSANFSAGFGELLKDENFVDCSLAAEGRTLKAHRAVLSAASAYFELLLTEEPERNPVIIFTDITFNELEALLRFIYRGEVVVSEDRLKKFLNVLMFLQIKGLDYNELVVRKTNVTTCDDDNSLITFKATTIPEATSICEEVEGEVCAQQFADNKCTVQQNLSWEGSSQTILASDYDSNVSPMPPCEVKTEPMDFENALSSSLSEPGCGCAFSSPVSGLEIKDLGEEISSLVKIEKDDITTKIQNEPTLEDGNDDNDSEASPGQLDAISDTNAESIPYQIPYEILYTEPLYEEESENSTQNINEDVAKSQMPSNNESKADKNIIDLTTKNESLVKTGPGSIKMPAILPSLTYDLKKKIEGCGVLASQKNLIYHWGSYLWQTTEGNPKKSDYQNLARSIVSAYPLLKGGPKGYDIVRAQLSTWIRNHRTSLKRQGQKRNNEENVIHVPKVLKVEISSETSAPSTLNVTQALLELEKKQGKEAITPYVQRLIKLTLNERHLWIKNKAKSILEVVTKYPHLKDYDSVLFEFYNLKNTTADLIFQNIKLMFCRLKNYFQFENENTNLEINLLKQLVDSLSKKSKTDVKPLFTFKQARSSTECLKTEENEAPRAVIYSENEEVNTAFIVAHTDTRISISNPTVPKVVACLLAAYYVWDMAFPKKYLNVLEYIDSEVLGTCIKKNQVLFKFIRKRDEKISST